MKTVISFRMTGENPADIEAMLVTTRQALIAADVEPYCTFFDREFITSQDNAKAILNHAFTKIDTANFLFVLLASNDRSEGMLIEVGYALANQIPVYVAIKDTVDGSYLPDLADRVLTWHEPADLGQSIAGFVRAKVGHTS